MDHDFLFFPFIALFNLLFLHVIRDPYFKLTYILHMELLELYKRLLTHFVFDKREAVYRYGRF